MTLTQSSGQSKTDIHTKFIKIRNKKTDNFDNIDWNAKDNSYVGPSFETDVVIITTQPATKPESNKNTTEELLLMDELADENGNYHYENGICNASSLKIELLPMKEQWIKMAITGLVRLEKFII